MTQRRNFTTVYVLCGNKLQTMFQIMSPEHKDQTNIFFIVSTLTVSIALCWLMRAAGFFVIVSRDLFHNAYIFQMMYIKQNYCKVLILITVYSLQRSIVSFCSGSYDLIGETVLDLEIYPDHIKNRNIHISSVSVSTATLINHWAPPHVHSCYFGSI